MIDDQQNALNLASAENIARANLGLQGTDVADWSEEEFLGYISELASIITQHPTQFNEVSLANAAAVLLQRNLVTSNWTDDQLQEAYTLKYELANNVSSVGDDLVSLGNGISNLLGNAGRTLDKGSAAVASAAGMVDLLVPGIAIVLFVWLIKDPVRATQAGKNIAGGTRELLPY